MADIEHDAARRRLLGEPIKVLVLEDRAAGLAVEAVGDDVALGQHAEHVVIKRRRFADMHHHRQLQDAAELFARA